MLSSDLKKGNEQDTSPRLHVSLERNVGWPCLREQKSGEKDDHGVAPCGRELACTNSTSITCVAA